MTLTVSVTSDESAGLTYTWYRFIDDEWCSLTNSYITQGLTEKYTGADSQTLSITELPAGQIFSYKVQIVTGDGYKCFSKPFTVSTCAHDGDKPCSMMKRITGMSVESAVRNLTEQSTVAAQRPVPQRRYAASAKLPTGSWEAIH